MIVGYNTEFFMIDKRDFLDGTGRSAEKRHDLLNFNKS